MNQRLHCVFRTNCVVAAYILQGLLCAYMGVLTICRVALIINQYDYHCVASYLLHVLRVALYAVQFCTSLHNNFFIVHEGFAPIHLYFYMQSARYDIL